MGRIGAMPTLVGGVILHPRGRVAAHLSELATDLLHSRAELGHGLAGCPLKLSSDVMADPEPPFSLVHELESGGELPCRDERVGIPQERLLLEAKRVNSPELFGWNLEASEAELILKLVSDQGVT